MARRRSGTARDVLWDRPDPVVLGVLGGGVVALLFGARLLRTGRWAPKPDAGLPGPTGTKTVAPKGSSPIDVRLAVPMDESQGVERRANLIATAWSIEPALAREIVRVADRQDVRADWLANLIGFESRFDPAIQNQRSGATGLIQFIPPTAAALGTSTSALRRMSALQQMEYVEDYLEGVRRGALGAPGGFPSKQALYLAIFYPAWRFDEPTKTFPERVRAANPGINRIQDYVDYVDRSANTRADWAGALARLGGA